MADSTRSALAKLRAAGIEPDTAQLSALAPSVQATEPSFDLLWNAVLERSRVSFTYRGGERRTLEPWGLTASKGRWYVIGHDTDRDATRMFKLSRITDQPRKVSRAGRVRGARPTSTCGPWPVRWRPASRRETALLAIRKGRAPTLARRGEPATAGAELPNGFEAFAVAYGDRWSLAEEIVQHGADVVVLAPAELRDSVVRSLRAVAGTGRAA